MPSVVTIVGKPNVGKSALFNRIAGRRIAIVHDMPGVTRDRVSAEVEWHGVPYTLIDTGGISLLKGEKKGDVITKSAMMQVELAIEEAELVLFVVDIQSGLTPLDQEVAERLRRSQKKVFLVCNKADTNALELHSHDFASFNFDRVFNVSAIHNRGIDALMNAVIRELPQIPEEERHPAPAPQNDADEDQAEMIEGPLKIAFVGRPNVGKSSIVNKLTQSNRVIVSPIPGTTRDSVDVPFSVETDGVKQDYILVDTAGVRKERRIHDSVEFYSIKRTEDSINRCDIAILMLDASEGILEQYKKVADKIVDAGKACIIVVNKWDLVAEGVKKMQEKEAERIAKIPVYKRTEEDQKKLTLAEFGAWVQEKLFFLSYAPVIFTSAENGFNLDRLLEAVRYVAAQLKQVIPTGLLNRTLATAIEEKLPVSARGNFLKFYYATQVKQAPPTFLLFVNRKELIQDSYQKFLAAKMRQAFGYEGCPIHFISRARPKTIESKHKPRIEKRRTVKKYSTRGQQREQIEGRARLRKRIAPRDAARRKGK
ncbi:MAG: ribosome biogenesis GTPase Der [Verrucomicrobia bacterium]|nr:ribosome biogenesis GTPase Der [Verrucomicrobiota bacterium]